METFLQCWDRVVFPSDSLVRVLGIKTGSQLAIGFLRYIQLFTHAVDPPSLILAITPCDTMSASYYLMSSRRFSGTRRWAWTTGGILAYSL